MDVRIAQGTFRGSRSGEILSFRGIPFAAAPVGHLRFAAPQRPTAHTGIADATHWGPTVPSPPQRSAVIGSLLPDPVRPGDECLNLNIWTPDTAARLPVLVFVHGGGFVTGTGSTTAFDGTAFARDGVVVVTINYRLAVDGFLPIPGAAPNRGLLDQVAALEWIRDNIAAFGGDPDRVTCSGESAGAMSVLTLMTMPRAKGLFHQAISQSGDGHHVHTAEQGAILVGELCGALDIPETAEAIAVVPLDVLHETTNTVITALTSGRDPAFAGFRRLAIQPVIDGDSLPVHPIDAVRDGAGDDIGLLIGTNAQEYGLFSAPTGLADSITDEILFGSVARLGVDAGAVIERYRSRMPGATTAELFVAIQSDWFCVIPTARYIEARAQRGVASHAYEFAWQPATFAGRLGACHTLEIPFVFDTLDDPWGIELRGPDAPKALADEMHSAWVAFVTSGDPGWPAHGVDRLIHRFDVLSASVSDPQAWRREAWADVIQ